jgi:pyridoxine/pyridoxamine 5'-phosphate oxidase
LSREPRASRPRFPGYGIHEEADGMLPWSWAVERLAAARNYWVGSTNADGSPHAAPVWALWWEDAVVFSTGADSRKGRNIARDPRVVVHLESGDEVVILEGGIERTTTDDAYADAYEAKYALRPEPGDGWLALAPSRALAWRERDYPQSATRFDF